ncbi:MAG: hypothetical protein KKG00_02765 [Bacteroidetes bacterium]|jgi:hypothetical protein|nr:hypothetical protein [Bacteroidota bacterium]
MKDFLSVVYIVFGVFALMGLLAFLNFHLSYGQLALLGILLSTILIVVFILYGPGKRRRK